MRNLSRSFILIGFIYLILAMVQGQYMAYVANYTYYPMHAHMALVGGFLMILYGVLHHAFPALQQDAFARAQFWVANIGAVIFFPGIGIAISGGTRNIGHTGSVLVIIALLIFSLMLYRFRAGNSAA